MEPARHQPYARKLWHLLGLAYPVAYYLGFTSRDQTLIAVAIAIIVVALVEAIRFADRNVAKTFALLFARILKAEEFSSITALIPYFFSIFITFIIFPKSIACAAVTYLIVGDTAAGLFGRALGRTELVPGKTLEGTLACFTVCFLIGWPLLGWQLALVSAGAAALAEMLSPGRVDNFTIPVAAGFAAWGLLAITSLPLPYYHF